MGVTSPSLKVLAGTPPFPLTQGFRQDPHIVAQPPCELPYVGEYDVDSPTQVLPFDITCGDTSYLLTSSCASWPCRDVNSLSLSPPTMIWRACMLLGCSHHSTLPLCSASMDVAPSRSLIGSF